MQCRLWQALGEHALKARDFDMAEKSFVRCAEYQVALQLLHPTSLPDVPTVLLLSQIYSVSCSFNKPQSPTWGASVVVTQIHMQAVSQPDRLAIFMPVKGTMQCALPKEFHLPSAATPDCQAGHCVIPASVTTASSLSTTIYQQNNNP